MGVDLAQKFFSIYGREPRVFRAPGRVNLIGEHTDYNDGFVLPAAIDREIQIAAAPRHDRRLHLSSLALEDEAEFDLNDQNPLPRKNWTDYCRGVVHVLETEGYRLPGADLLIESEIPLGAGLSSSAALEVATALTLLSLADYTLKPLELAKLCQKAENDFVGTRCGIMDQVSACFGRSGHAMLIDCRSLELEYIPMDKSIFSTVVVNTMVKHELAESEYNQRRAECEAGVEKLGKILPGIKSLRDVSTDEFNEVMEKLPENMRARCRHVIFENERTRAAAERMSIGDLPGVGRLMAESHRSLRNDYRVSCSELDLLVELAEGIEGVYGARMTGGGFGGCTVNLVASESVEDFHANIEDGYYRATGIRPEVYVCRTRDGASEIRGNI